MEIKTNNQPRPVLYWFDLTDEERSEFSYYDDDTSQELAQFFRYRGDVYDIYEFDVVKNPFRDQFSGWDAFRSDSFFSGLVIRYVPDSNYEQVVVGLYIS